MIQGRQILEVNGRGHRLWYVALLLRRLQEGAMTKPYTLVVRPPVVELPQWQEYPEFSRASAEDRVHRSEKSKLTILKSVMGSEDSVVIPDGDAWLTSLVGVRFVTTGRLTGTVLLMRPQPDATRASRFRHFLKAAIIRATTLVHPDLEFRSLVAVQGDRPAVPEILDPVDFAPLGTPRDQWLREQDLDPSLKWLVVLGEISRRKCIDSLIQAVSTDQASVTRWGLVILGKPHDLEMATALVEASLAHPSRIVHREAFLSDREFDTWVANADVIPVLYTNEGSSGVLLKAWAAGTPVLAGGSRSVLEAVRVLGVTSVTVDDLSAAGVLKGIELMELNGARQPAPQWAGRSREFANGLLQV